MNKTKTTKEKKEHQHKFKIIKIEEGYEKFLFLNHKVWIYTLQCRLCGDIRFRTVLKGEKGYFQNIK